MQRDFLLLGEMIEAAEQIQELRNRIVHGYWSIDFAILIETAQK